MSSSNPLPRNQNMGFILTTMVRYLPMACLIVFSSTVVNAADSGPIKGKLSEQITRLDNGATVILKPIPGTDRISIESFYDVGFIDEPQEMTQAAHLVEHLVCYSATKSYQPKESFKLLERLGMVNAETLPEFTHYDYTVPKGQLEPVLKVEAERLSSLQIETDMIRREIPRIDSETDTVESRPATGMLKHAVMALSQGWQFASTKALVRGQLGSIPIEQIRAFHKETYRPDRLTLIVVGDFDVTDAKTMIDRTIGACENPPVVEQPTIDWQNVPSPLTVKWDASVTATCTYYPPPADPFERFVLTMLGTVWSNSIAQDGALNRSANMVFASSIQWSVGRLPMFIYVAAKKPDRLEKIEGMVAAKLDRLINDSAKTSLQQIQTAVPSVFTQLQLESTAQIEVGVGMIARQFGGDRKKAIDMVMGQSAINRYVLKRLAGDQSEELLARLKRLTVNELQTLMNERINPSQRKIIRLEAISSRTD